MSKDYAKNIFVHQRKRPKKKNSQGGLLAALLVISIIGAGTYLFHTQMITKEKLLSWKEDIKSYLSHNKNPVLGITKSKTVEAANSPDEGVRFDFYTELPNMKMNQMVSEDTLKPINTSVVKAAPAADVDADTDDDLSDQIEKTIQSAAADAKDAAKDAKASVVAEVASSKKFKLQLGVFKSESDASQMRISLLLAGFTADIVKGKKGFVVQQGPFVTEAQAKAVLSKLEKKGYAGEIKNDEEA